MNAAKINSDLKQVQIRLEDSTNENIPIIIDKDNSPFVSLADMNSFFTEGDDRIAGIFVTSDDINSLFTASK